MRARWYEDRALSRRARARDAGMGMGTAYLCIWRHAELPNGSFELPMITKLWLVAAISSLVGPLDGYLNRFGRCAPCRSTPPAAYDERQTLTSTVCAC